jgi:CO dehydrogenase/acetyl-CoA synthase alpha subunit
LICDFNAANFSFFVLVFGKLDSELHRAPHCSLRTIESKIVYTNNSTASWLNDKTAADKESIIKKAMEGNQKFIDDSKQKEKKLHENRIKILQEREKTKTKRKEKRLLAMMLYCYLYI